MADIQHYASNLQRNLANSFNMDLKSWIRLIVVVGAYALMRPYLMKLGAKLQSREHEKELDPDEVGIISPNSLRGQVEVPDDSDSEPEKAEGTGADWGKKARKRQRQMLRKVLEEDEKLRKEQQEDDEDKDIMEYLVDYEEGVDGW